MKKIILSLTIGLVVGYGVTSALENTEIAQLEADNTKAKQQIVKLSEQLLASKKQTKPTQQAPRSAQRNQSKTITSGGFNRQTLSKEQMLAQRKQAMERMRAQQKANAQMHATEQDKDKVKTTKGGVVL
ncbi:hypothetical protein A9Q98_10375 [Thalassotalea sp. 42_200_T64]|nr:hypothetical protein A9Q98_10375 [Thalassotalea sp. 42_200_T64]